MFIFMTRFAQLQCCLLHQSLAFYFSLLSLSEAADCLSLLPWQKQLLLLLPLFMFARFCWLVFTLSVARAQTAQTSSARQLPANQKLPRTSDEWQHLLPIPFRAQQLSVPLLSLTGLPELTKLWSSSIEADNGGKWELIPWASTPHGNSCFPWIQL